MRSFATVAPVLFSLAALIPPASARAPSPQREAVPTRQLEARHEHVLNRIGYGPDAWSRQRIASLGVHDYIEEQLDPEQIDDAAFEARIAHYPWRAMSYAELRANYCGSCPLGNAGIPRKELREAKILRSIYSRRQLAAVLTDFWFDHFNVDARGGLARWDIIPYERDAIAPHVLGRFEDMLLAVAQSPAMLDYLDNRRNYRDGYVNGNGDVLGINENYARELMELHTLGVDGGYTQNDVIEVARILTGWSTNAEGFRYKNFVHDQDPKLVMETLEIPANGGIDDGLSLIAFLANHPRTAERLSRLLVQRFVSEDPPEALVQAAAATYLATGGDLREVMRTLLHSPEFLRRPYRTKVKRPLVLLASAARALQVPQAEAELNRFRNELVAMGESLYEAAPPTGYPDASPYWSSEGTLLARFNALRWMVYDADLGIDLGVADGTAAEVVEALVPRLFLGPVPPSTRAAVRDYLDTIPNASAANRLRDAASLLLSSPDFLRH